MRFYGVNFILQKFCLCKKMTNIRYGPDQNHLDYQKDSGDAEDNNDSLKEGDEPEEESLEGNDSCIVHMF